MCDANLGMAILAALNPRFPVAQVVRVLAASPRPTFSFLAGGTFGKQWYNIDRILEGLEKRGKLPKRVSVYLDCGPCRRPRRSGNLMHLQPRLTIHQLNAALEQKGSRLYKRIVMAWHLQTLRVIRQAIKYPEIEWRIYPALEDDLTHANFRILANEVDRLMRQTNVTYSIGRNRNGTPDGHWPKELHYWPARESLSLLEKGDAVSGDGVFRDPSVQEVRSVIARGADVYLWRPEWQGYVPGREILARDRVYKIIDQEKIRDLLKRGTPCD